MMPLGQYMGGEAMAKPPVFSIGALLMPVVPPQSPATDKADTIGACSTGNSFIRINIYAS
jgi:hypothetical protein